MTFIMVSGSRSSMAFVGTRTTGRRSSCIRGPRSNILLRGQYQLREAPNDTSRLHSNLLKTLEAIDQPVTSNKSKTVKLYQSLSKSKIRSKEQKTILEGHRLIIDTLSDERHQTRKLYRDVLVTKDALLHPQLGEKLSHQLERLRNEGPCMVRLATESVMKAACDTVTPQGVAAVVDIPPPFMVRDHKSYNDNKNEDDGASDDHDDSVKKSKLYLLLDGISDPGNVGTLLRSAKAVGAEAVILLPNSCDVWNPKAIRSAMGTSFQVPIREVQSWDECLQLMESCGVTGNRIYAATMDDADADQAEVQNDDKHHIRGQGFKSLPHFRVNWTSDSNALVLGKEGPGLSQELRNSVKEGQIRSVHVPMEAGIESLNAAVCGSVIMFEYLRQYQEQQR